MVGKELQEPLHGRVDLRDIPGRQDVKQQTANDCDGQAGIGPGGRRVPSACREHGCEGADPVIDDPWQKGLRPFATLECLAVDLEKQPLLRSEPGTSQVRPESPSKFLDRPVRAGAQLGEESVLAGLDGSDHLYEQAFFRTEVVNEHPVARPGCLGDRAEALVGDAVGQC